MIEKVHEPLVTAVLQDITRDRRGVSTYSNILRDVIHSFVEVRDVIHSFVEVRVRTACFIYRSGRVIWRYEVKMRELVIPRLLSPVILTQRLSD